MSFYPEMSTLSMFYMLARFFRSIFYENISLQIMGKWYVVEVLEHRMDPMKSPSSSYIVDSCPIVKLKPLDYASLRLLWSEESGNVEYTFRIPDIARRKGLWRTMTSQNGKIPFISTRSSKLQLIPKFAHYFGLPIIYSLSCLHILFSSEI